MTPEDLEAVRRVVRQEIDAALARHLPRPDPKPKKSRAGLLTLAQAGELLGGTPTETIRRWVWEGKLTAYKPGKHPLVKESELLALVEASESRKKRVARRRAAWAALHAGGE